MKARFKATGETVDVKPFGTMNVSCSAYITEDGHKMPGTALEFEKEINWEQRRYELAKSAMQGVLSNPAFCNMQSKESITIKIAIVCADEMIKNLKGGER